MPLPRVVLKTVATGLSQCAASRASALVDSKGKGLQRVAECRKRPADSPWGSGRHTEEWSGSAQQHTDDWTQDAAGGPWAGGGRGRRRLQALGRQGGARHVALDSPGQCKPGWHRRQPLSANGRARPSACRGQPIRAAAGGKPAPRACPISGKADATSTGVWAPPHPLGRRSPRLPRGALLRPRSSVCASRGRARHAPLPSERATHSGLFSPPLGAPGAVRPGGAVRAISGARR